MEGGKMRISRQVVWFAALTVLTGALSHPDRCEAQTVNVARPSAAATGKSKPYLLKPKNVFTSSDPSPKADCGIVVKGDKIVEVGPLPQINVPKEAIVIELPNCTMTAGLIDAHTHVLLHPYNEASWNDQVLKEPRALRVCRATNHLRDILASGFTTIRDLGTEGAGYADVGLKQSVAQGIVPGPRMLVTTRAIVATGSYGPKGFAPEFAIPQGAEEADGIDSLTRVVRDQIGKGADWIKVYADAAMGGAEVRPTFSLQELRLIVEVSQSAGIPVVAHANSKEGMRRAALAGVASIEHGKGGDAEVFRLMAQRNVAFCPTLAAYEAMERYRGWQPSSQSEPADIRSLRTVRPSLRHERSESRVSVGSVGRRWWPLWHRRGVARPRAGPVAAGDRS